MSQKKNKKKQINHQRWQKQTATHQRTPSRTAFGQTVPPASSGVGKQVLYRCPMCQHLWLQDGYQVRQRLSPEEITTQVLRLSVDQTRLPLATCRLCLFQAGSGAFEFDEYRETSIIGYGINWEAAEPVGAHAQATILAESSMRPQMVPDVVRDPKLARAVLTWLHQARVFPCVHVLDEQECAQIAINNPAGHGMTGTERWQWKGALFRLPCPPLGGAAIILLAFAQPPEQPLDIAGLVSLWQELAALALEGRFSGEQA
jgi:hypothetical protein